MDRATIVAGYLGALQLTRQSPGSEFLSRLMSAHVARFAFCSVGPQLGCELPLDLPSLYARIVLQRRGGYCFEQNGLLFEVLEELGFDVSLYLARVIYDQDIHPGLTHRISVVKIDGVRLVVDAGFGPKGPRFPVDLSGTVSQQGERAFRVFERRAGELHLQTLDHDAWFSLYRFELSRYGQADCELGHFFSHRHPNASFVRNLVASRILSDEVRSLRNRDYRVSRVKGDEQYEIRDSAHLREVLEVAFDVGVTVAEARRLFAALP